MTSPRRFETGDRGGHPALRECFYGDVDVVAAALPPFDATPA
jgi:hypothetical protein